MTGRSSSRPLIHWHRISIRVYDRQFFMDTDWCIRPGEQWGVIGGNGSGKTILARALRAELPLIGGEYEFNFPGRANPEDAVAIVSFRDQAGKETADFYQARWSSFDGAAQKTVSQFLSAREVFEINPFEVGSFSGNSAAFRRRQTRIIGMFEIGGLQKRRMIHLSNGEMRKVLMVRALLRSPAMVVLDDPFTGLDPAYRRRLKGIIGRLIRSGTSIVLMTSRPEELPAGITHAAVIADGHFVAAGPRRKVLQSPAVKALYPTRGSQETSRGKGARLGAELVSLRDVTVEYDEQPVLSNITWQIRAGQHWAVFGPNGSGKTSLLSLLTGDNPQAYSNDICLFGRRRGSGESIWDIKRHIGHVAPEVQLAFEGDLTGFEAVCSGWFDSIGLFEECSPTQLRKARKIMRELELFAYADREMDELSDGQQRMLLLARAMIKKPLLLILDEPCQGLDRGNRERFHDLLYQVAMHSRVTMIYVTHRHQEVPSWITNRLRLKNGRITRRSS